MKAVERSEWQGRWHLLKPANWTGMAFGWRFIPLVDDDFGVQSEVSIALDAGTDLKFVILGITTLETSK